MEATAREAKEENDIEDSEKKLCFKTEISKKTCKRCLREKEIAKFQQEKQKKKIIKQHETSPTTTR